MTSSATSALDARDVRTGGRWTLPQRIKNGILRHSIRLLLAIADRVPEALLFGVGRWFGRFAFFFFGKASRTAVKNISVALPDCDARAIARASFVSAGESLATTLLLRRPNVRALDRLIVPDADRAELESALAAGRGAVVVSAHLGAFELLPAAVAELGLNPAIVVRESYDPKLDPIVDRHRLERGIGVIHRGKPGSGTRIVRALRQGRPVGILPDLGGRVPSVPVDFLGRRVAFPVGPARIARGIRVPLLIATVSPISRLQQQLQVRPIAFAPDECDEATMTQRVANELATAIRACPTAWLWVPRL